MLRGLLHDSAVSAAKAYAHDRVEPRHVLYAAARHFRERPEIAPLVAPAKRALDPRGISIAQPEITPEAAALLDSFSSERGALAGLLAAFQDPPKSSEERPNPMQAELDLRPDLGATEVPAPSTGGSRESTGAVLAELNALVGLASVKRQVAKVIAVVQANEERKKAGLPLVNPGLHLVFTGPPGTGKTTVARLVARLYASTGALPGANFIEASRTDLVAGYVGQTAIKTAKVIERARPGVLFVDEAYALTPSHESDFGAEAVATLVKSMEDHRDDFAVIFAGYGEEMVALIGSNPGLRSRFKTFIEFPGFAPEELARIFALFAEKHAIALASGVIEKVEDIMRRASGGKGFGNARYARSLFEEAFARMSARAAEDSVVTVDELQTFTPEDVEWRSEQMQREPRRIGFGTEEGGSGAPS
jgi:stage V sporulation protein K